MSPVVRDTAPEGATRGSEAADEGPAKNEQEEASRIPDPDAADKQPTSAAEPAADSEAARPQAETDEAPQGAREAGQDEQTEDKSSG